MRPIHSIFLAVLPRKWGKSFLSEFELLNKAQAVISLIQSHLIRKEKWKQNYLHAAIEGIKFIDYFCHFHKRIFLISRSRTNFPLSNDLKLGEEIPSLSWEWVEVAAVYNLLFFINSVSIFPANLLWTHLMKLKTK